jgi:hypothetical protein
MKTSLTCRICSLIAGAAFLTVAPFGAHAQLTVQSKCNVVGTGSNAWNFLVLEAESFIPETKVAAEGTGFVKLYNDEALASFYGTPMLATNTDASMQAALGTVGPTFGRFADKVTYQVVFSAPGDYYTYMRFTMLENGGNLGSYGNEDSFYLPAGFNKDPQTDWNVPGDSVTDTGGYTEGCCSGAGFLFILDYQGNGTRTDHSTGANTNYWEGNFHWNQLFVSQFLNPAIHTNSDGTPFAGQPIHYVVTPAMVGVPQNFTIAYREQGVTIDCFTFSTHTNLLNDYTQSQLDDLLVKKVQAQDPASTVASTNGPWSFLVMEAESYMAKSNHNVSAGFAAVYPGSTNISYYGAPILQTNTGASGKGALLTQSPSFGLFSDKVAYRVKFATPGDYYLYFRFTMYENGGNLTHYISEDSFFVPPDFNKDPQFDWNPPGTTGNNDGGYTEGCCGGAGFLYILDYQGNGSRTDHSGETNTVPNGTNYWEGNFHWNQLISSQFLNPDTQGAPSVPFHYVVTPAMVNIPQTFTIAYREGGVTPDLFLFSTHTNMMNDYTQAELDQLLLQPKLSIASSGTNVIVSWPVSACGFILESRSALDAGSWSTVQASSTLNGDRYNLTVTPTGTRYYRLRQP